jgi:hypothetical protein
MAASNVTNVAVTCTGNPCTLPWGGSINHGQSVTAFQSSSVVCGGSCVSQTRTCSLGVLSGTHTKQACTIQSCCAADEGAACTYTVTEGPFCGSWGNCSDPAFLASPTNCVNFGWSLSCVDTGPDSNCSTCSQSRPGTIQCDGGCQ